MTPVNRCGAARAALWRVRRSAERVQRLIDEFKQSQLAECLTTLTQRAQACMALGCSGLPTKHFRPIQKLAGYALLERHPALAASLSENSVGSIARHKLPIASSIARTVGGLRSERRR